MELLVAPGGAVEVGEGRTSLNREGSLLSLFQIALVHGNAEPPAARPSPAEAEWVPQVPGPVSPDGVVGCDAVGDIEPLAIDPLRGRAKGADVSFSQDDRRVGLAGCAAVCVDS
jgi:hypothetical protein